MHFIHCANSIFIASTTWIVWFEYILLIRHNWNLLASLFRENTHSPTRIQLFKLLTTIGIVNLTNNFFNSKRKREQIKEKIISSRECIRRCGSDGNRIRLIIKRTYKKIRNIKYFLNLMAFAVSYMLISNNFLYLFIISMKF
jgi:hypothetical protein